MLAVVGRPFGKGINHKDRRLRRATKARSKVDSPPRSEKNDILACTVRCRPVAQV